LDVSKAAPERFKSSIVDYVASVQLILALNAMAFIRDLTPAENVRTESRGTHLQIVQNYSRSSFRTILTLLASNFSACPDKKAIVHSQMLLELRQKVLSANEQERSNKTVLLNQSEPERMTDNWKG
jgi:hypothetical protein